MEAVTISQSWTSRRGSSKAVMLLLIAINTPPSERDLSFLNNNNNNNNTFNQGEPISKRCYQLVPYVTKKEQIITIIIIILKISYKNTRSDKAIRSARIDEFDLKFPIRIGV